MIPRILLAGSIAAIIHLVLIAATGHQFGPALGVEIVVRWLIGGVLLFSIRWPMPIVVNGVVVGMLLGIGTALTLNTVGLSDTDPPYAVLTNTLIGVALGVGGLIAKALFPLREDAASGEDVDSDGKGST